jgi:hypothetical protein
MIKSIFKKSNLFGICFAFISCFAFCVVLFRSYLVPLNHDEAATFFFFIQSGNYMPFYSQVDANNHVLNSFLCNLCFHLFGSSPFALRLPNTLSFLLLVIGVYKLSKYLVKFEAKLFLVIAFLASFHWVTFFSACRGYGLSMALLVIGIAFMIDYIKNLDKKKYFVLMLLFFQLAISANLILLLITLLLCGIVLVIQIANKRLFNSFSIIFWILFFSIFYYWLSFSFFLQDSGALYYGEGDSYWKVTFLTLVKLLIFSPTVLLKYILVSFFVLCISLNLYYNRQYLTKPFEQLKNPSLSLLFLIILSVLILGFYAMHKILGINYPEDRTGLFYYVFFVLFATFTFDIISISYFKYVILCICISILIHFAINLNFRKHSLYVYETIPEHFYTTLLNEQNKSDHRITIGGHRVRELFYGYWNYRNNGILNPADPSNNMQMCFDYYISTIAEKPFWDKYYSVIDSEPDWGFVILKRKEPIIKKKFIDLNNLVIDASGKDFNDVYHKADTVFYESKPLLAEIDFDIIDIEKPTNTWLVFAINDSLGNAFHFIRYPLQWSGYDLSNRKHLKYSITMGNLPPKAKNIVFFFWNINIQSLKLKVNSLKIYQLDGNGVEIVSPAIN